MYSTFNRKNFDSLQQVLFFGENVEVTTGLTKVSKSLSYLFQCLDIKDNPHVVFYLCFLILCCLTQKLFKTVERRLVLEKLLPLVRLRIRAPPYCYSSEPISPKNGCTCIMIHP